MANSEFGALEPAASVRLHSPAPPVRRRLVDLGNCARSTPEDFLTIVPERELQVVKSPEPPEERLTLWSRNDHRRSVKTIITRSPGQTSAVHGGPISPKGLNVNKASPFPLFVYYSPELIFCPPVDNKTRVLAILACVRAQQLTQAADAIAPTPIHIHIDTSGLPDADSIIPNPGPKEPSQILGSLGHPDSCEGDVRRMHLDNWPQSLQRQRWEANALLIRFRSKGWFITHLLNTRESPSAPTRVVVVVNGTMTERSVVAQAKPALTEYVLCTLSGVLSVEFANNLQTLRHFCAQRSSLETSDWKSSSLGLRKNHEVSLLGSPHPRVCQQTAYLGHGR
ncbi:hypothetical protein H920_15009 [Fukomys damarensis]|uniref:Uncharacterized protein n=1 Tax=Fukomys damarensis TaxID=885580 RepID=A0A091D0V5_FUKDA|nr:hypothetical protein H920_15009 [Fukomys damarensis]